MRKNMLKKYCQNLLGTSLIAFLGATSALAIQAPVVRESDIYQALMMDFDDGLTFDRHGAIQPYEDPPVTPGYRSWKIQERMHRTRTGLVPGAAYPMSGRPVVDLHGQPLADRHPRIVVPLAHSPNSNLPAGVAAYGEASINDYFRDINIMGFGGLRLPRNLTLDPRHVGNLSSVIPAGAKAPGDLFEHVTVVAAVGGHGCHYTYNFDDALGNRYRWDIYLHSPNPAPVVHVPLLPLLPIHVPVPVAMAAVPQRQELANKIQAVRGAPLPAADLAAIAALPAPVAEFALNHDLPPAAQPGRVDAGRGVTIGAQGSVAHRLVGNRSLGFAR